MMSRRKGIEAQLNALQAVERDSLERLHTVRRQIWQDHTIPAIDRVVLALSGSTETLLKYQEIARKVGELIGEPIIKIQSTGHDRGSIRDREQPDWVRTAFGGLIAGEMTVRSQSLNDTSGHAILEVPVDPVVARQHFEGSAPYIYDESGTRDRAVEIAHLVLHDWDNSKGAPKNEFYDTESHVVMGRAEIYGSEYFQIGLSDTLLAIEAAVAAKQFA